MSSTQRLLANSAFSLQVVLVIFLCSIAPQLPAVAEEPSNPPEYRIQLDVAGQGFDKETCWVHARAGIIPSENGSEPEVVMTMQKLLLSGSDVFYALNELRTDNLGAEWVGPIEHVTLGRRDEPNGIEVCICDVTPKWHAATGKLLGTGQSVRYQKNHVMKVRRREVAYSVYDQEDRTWSLWDTLSLPDDREDFQNAGTGSGQRYDLPNGELLVPIYFKRPDETQFATTVLRCKFDGEKLTYVEHGSEHTVPIKRGLYEPSITKFGDRYFLTLRNDLAGYVTSGSDGLHFAEPIIWKFDDGEELGNYNTQQHWVTHSDGLFLVYTRRGADNDHVFRHRAPLFIAQVDPERLCVLRETERVLVPEHGARLGNFGVVDVSQDETWVTVTEWMQPRGVEEHGSDNRIYVARILWSSPNELAGQP